jgi:hypothetical protein
MSISRWNLCGLLIILAGSCKSLDNKRDFPSHKSQDVSLPDTLSDVLLFDADRQDGCEEAEDDWLTNCPFRKSVVSPKYTSDQLQRDDQLSLSFDFQCEIFPSDQSILLDIGDFRTELTVTPSPETLNIALAQINRNELATMKFIGSWRAEALVDRRCQLILSQALIASAGLESPDG